MNQRRIRPHRCLIYIYSGRSTNGHNGTLPLPKAYIFLSIFFSLFRYFFGHGCFNIYVLRVSPEYKFGANMKKREMVAALIVAYGVHSKSSMCMLITLPVFFSCHPLFRMMFASSTFPCDIWRNVENYLVSFSLPSLDVWGSCASIYPPQGLNFHRE